MQHNTDLKEKYFALYCVLSMRGYLTEEELMNCCKDGSRLGAHPPKNLVPFAPFATGSLGHGASLSAGVALGRKLQVSSVKGEGLGRYEDTLESHYIKVTQEIAGCSL